MFHGQAEVSGLPDDIPDDIFSSGAPWTPQYQALSLFSPFIFQPVWQYMFYLLLPAVPAVSVLN